MRRLTSTSLFIVTSLFVTLSSAQQTSTAAIPNLIRYSGTLKDAQGAALSPTTPIGVTFAIYKQQEGGAPVWQETQNVTLDANGQYSVLLGSTAATGLPSDLFAQEEQRWLGVQVQGEPEQARSLLVSVPYAFKAHEAETLGGLPAAAFVKAPPSADSSATSISASVGATQTATGSNGTPSKSGVGIKTVVNCTTAAKNYIPVFTAVMPPNITICNSAIYQAGSNIGIGTTSPVELLHLKVPADGSAAAVRLETPPPGRTFSVMSVAGSDPRFLIQDDAQDGTGGERMMIDAGGRVGIGTNVPLDLLHLKVSSNQIAAGIRLETPPPGRSWTVLSIPGSDPRLSFIDNGSSAERMVITSGGDVGINTDAPGARLEVDENGGAPAIYATTNGGSTAAVLGMNSSGGYGIIGHTNSNSAAAVFGDNAAGNAGDFNGDLHVSHTVRIGSDLYVNGSKNFMIDHPLDPTNKYLIHSCVESNERKNVYDGIVITDAQGEALVKLPDYFEALNVDFRYQLTVVGQFAQAIVVQEVHDNQFFIKTDKPNVKVSWQVTGIRQDAYARAHPFAPEEDKPDKERGLYLSPIEHGQPESMGIYVPPGSNSSNPGLRK